MKLTIFAATGGKSSRVGSLGSSVRCGVSWQSDRWRPLRKRRVRLPGARARAERPGRGGDDEENQRRRDLSGGIAGEGVGRGGAGQIEEDTGVGPLLQARQARG